MTGSSVTLGYVLDEIFLEHRGPAGHPERPARAAAVRDALINAGIASLGTRILPRPATHEELTRVHGSAFLAELEKTVPGNSGWIDPDTYFSPGSWNAALAAAGSACDLATKVLAGEFQHAIAVVRPPGHHAMRNRAMGFCLLNNVAVAAAAARAAGAAKVAIVDWDVHHGNGTQDIFWDDPSVLYMSVHQYPYYPGTGGPNEIGGPNARGATINVGLPSGSGDADYLATFDEVFVPALARFAPDLILISAGFDAFERDPLAGMRVTHAGFAAMARRVQFAAEACAGGRILAVLEGGYDLDGVAGGMAATLAVLSTRDPDRVAPVASAAAPAPGTLARAAIEGTLAALAAPKRNEP